MGMIIYVVCRNVPALNAFAVEGANASKDEAEKLCVTEEHFIGPMSVESASQWPGAWFPQTERTDYRGRVVGKRTPKP